MILHLVPTVARPFCNTYPFPSSAGRKTTLQFSFQSGLKESSSRYQSNRSTRVSMSSPDHICESSLDKDHEITVHGVSDTVVGVLGGGQLGRMLCQAASQMAIKVGNSGFYLAHQLIAKALNLLGVGVHWYDKPEIRKQRKIRHITIVGPSKCNVKARLDSLLESETPGSHDFVTPRVGIIMGSDSDLPTMKDVAMVLKSFEVPYEVRIVSAHRTPDWMITYASSAKERGIQIIIAGAGGAAHLPGMVASLTSLPVIGVPIKTSSLDGIYSLLSIAQMPTGTPVATVAIGNGGHAALLAVRILTVIDSDLSDRAIKYQNESRDIVLGKATKLEAEVTPRVGIIMGSDSDLPTMKDAVTPRVGIIMGSDSDLPTRQVTIVSADRVPDKIFTYASSAKERGIQIIIVGASDTTYLLGMVASLTSLPVIGVPVQIPSLDGIDSLLSIFQMSKGIPVATVAIENAALLAVRILGVSDSHLLDRVIKYQNESRDTVFAKATKLEAEGWERYLNE